MRWDKLFAASFAGFIVWYVCPSIFFGSVSNFIYISLYMCLPAIIFTMIQYWYDRKAS